MFFIRNVAQFPFVHVLGFALFDVRASLVQNAFRVHHRAQRGGCAARKNQTADRHIRRACANERDLHFTNFLADHFQGVDQTSERHRRRALLIVVPDRNFALLAERVKNAKTFRIRNVFEVDAAKTGLQEFHRFDDLVRVFGVEHQRKTIHAAEILVEQGLAFHHRHTGFGSNVAETQDARAIADDGDGVPFVRVLIHEFRVGLNRLARRGDAGRIPNREIAKIAHATFQRRLDFTAIKRMQF